MEASMLMAKEYMKRSGLTDLRLAQRAIKAMVSFARQGAEVGVLGQMTKPNLEVCLAIQKGINKLILQEKGRLPPRHQPKKLFYTSAPGSRDKWEKLPGEVREQCCRCWHVLEEGEERNKKEREPGIWTEVCPRCGCAEYYLFKYEVPV